MNKPSANHYLVSSALTLNLFWILNISKTAFPEFKAMLNFYPPVGPLLGVYLLSIIAFIFFSLTTKSMKLKSSRSAYWFFVISALLFFFMVFPPVFEPIAHSLQ